MKQVLLTALAALALAAPALAQNLGPNLAGSFWAEDLQTHQGKIAIDPTSHTVLRFPEEVTFAFSRRSDVLKAVPKGSDLLLYATAEKADTDLSVLAEGKWHFFKVSVAKGHGLRFYEVKPRGEAALKGQAANAQGAPAAPGRVAQPAADVALPRAATPASPSGEPAASLVGPSWLHFALVPAPAFNGEVRLFYVVENRGDKKIVVDEKRLRVLRGDTALEFAVERPAGQLILEPGQTQSGLIRVKGSPGPLRLQWSVRPLGSWDPVVVEALAP